MDTEDKVLGAALVLMVLLIIVGIYFMVKDHNQWEAWCKEQGGIVDSVSKTGVGTGISTGGKPVTTTTTTTTYYCIADGELLDVK